MIRYVVAVGLFFKESYEEVVVRRCWKRRVARGRTTAALGRAARPAATTELTSPATVELGEEERPAPAPPSR